MKAYRVDIQCSHNGFVIVDVLIPDGGGHHRHIAPDLAKACAWIAATVTLEPMP